MSEVSGVGEKQNSTYSRIVIPGESWVQVAPDKVSEASQKLSKTLCLRPGRFERLPRRLAPCLLCPKVSDSYLLLSQHMLLAHDYCPVCRLVQSDMIGHLRTHHLLQFFRCSFFGCAQTFWDPGHCVEHECRVHDSVPPADGHELSESQREHPFRPDDLDAFHCIYCAEFFERLQTLEAHLLDAHDVCKCPDCQNYFYTGQNCIVCAQN